MRNKNVAGTLALILGMFGTHRFYLGRKSQGVLHFLLFFFTLIITVEEGDPIILVPLALGFIDAILFFVMPTEEFDRKYNKDLEHSGYAYATESRFAREGYREPPRMSSGRQEVTDNTSDPDKQLGIQLFREYDFRGAVEAFQRSLNRVYDAPSTHFNLACCYSMMEMTHDALFHLEKAVEFGFDDFEKIHRHNSLSYLRAQPEFDRFVRNEYSLAGLLPPPEPNLLDEPDPLSQSSRLLDQLMQLGELREKGLLTEAEFDMQKKKLLAGE